MLLFFRFDALLFHAKNGFKAIIIYRIAKWFEAGSFILGVFSGEMFHIPKNQTISRVAGQDRKVNGDFFPCVKVSTRNKKLCRVASLFSFCLSCPLFFLLKARFLNMPETHNSSSLAW